MINYILIKYILIPKQAKNIRLGGKFNMKERKKMNNLALKQEIEQKYSYADLLNFPENERYEIIDGNLYLMSAPTVIHQGILGELYRQISNYLLGKKCKVFSSPIDVKLSGKKDDKKEFNVVQPDLLIVCDESKIQKNCILGAPDFIVEILSPSTSSMDRVKKFNLYQKFGVKEYWIVAPEEKNISVFLLNKEGIYTIPKAYYLTDKVPVNIVKGLNIDLNIYCKENEELLVKK